MELIFQNETGTLNLSGLGGGTFSICNIEGLTPIEKSRALKSYTGEDGVYEDSSQYTQRIITVSGDIKSKSDFSKIFHKASKILSRKGVLTIKSDGFNKKITVNSAIISIGTKNKSFTTFVIQMTCDYPHFTDEDETVVSIFQKIPLLKSTSSLPSILSKRISQGVVDNIGDLKVYPVITIKRTAPTSSSNKLEIKNNTINKGIILEKNFVQNEVIVIDAKDRTITSNVYGNIVNSLEFYSSLSDLWIDYGENIISVSIDGSQEGIDVSISYYNEYLEAI